MRSWLAERLCVILEFSRLCPWLVCVAGEADVSPKVSQISFRWLFYCFVMCCTRLIHQTRFSLCWKMEIHPFTVNFWVRLLCYICPQQEFCPKASNGHYVCWYFLQMTSGLNFQRCALLGTIRKHQCTDTFHRSNFPHSVTEGFLPVSWMRKGCGRGEEEFWHFSLF